MGRLRLLFLKLDEVEALLRDEEQGPLQQVVLDSVELDDSFLFICNTCGVWLSMF